MLYPILVVRLICSFWVAQRFIAAITGSFESRL